MNHLKGAIGRAANVLTVDSRRLSTLVATMATVTMLNYPAIKGGTALQLRYGLLKSRATRDIDIVVTQTLVQFEDEAAQRLAIGWQGFTGTIQREASADPERSTMPPGETMTPFTVHLYFEGRPFAVSHVEVVTNLTGEADMLSNVLMAPVDIDILHDLGFSLAEHANTVLPEYLVAGKLHGLMNPYYARAHDLADLEALIQREHIDFELLVTAVVDVFTRSNQCPRWVSSLDPGKYSRRAYEEASYDLDMVTTYNAALEHADRLIQALGARIDFGSCDGIACVRLR